MSKIKSLKVKKVSVLKNRACRYCSNNKLFERKVGTLKCTACKRDQ
jgi:hypothetical protein